MPSFSFLMFSSSTSRTGKKREGLFACPLYVRWRFESGMGQNEITISPADLFCVFSETHERT